MKCPICQHADSKVVDSRESQDGDSIRRRRECLRCGRRFTTYERIDPVMPMVVKKDGRREPWERAKVLSGLLRACEKRPVSADTIESVAGDVERTIQDLGGREVDSAIIGEEIVSRLKRLDEVAYVRFASVYRSFRDIDEFMSELESLVKERTARKDG